MLIQLTYDQIGELWNFIAEELPAALPPTECAKEQVEGVLLNLLSGKFQMWAYKREKHVTGIVITSVMDDLIGNGRNLFIYAILGFQDIEFNMFTDGLRALSKWAAANGCEKITGYTNHPAVIGLVERLKGSTDMRLVVLPLRLKNKDSEGI